MYDEEDGYIKLNPDNTLNDKREWDYSFYRDWTTGRTNKNTIDTQVESIQEIYKGNPHSFGSYSTTDEEIPSSKYEYYNELNLLQNIISTKQGEYADLNLDPSDIEILKPDDKDKASILMKFLTHYAKNIRFKKVVNDTIFESLLFPMGITWIKYDHGLTNFTTSDGKVVNGDLDFKNVPLPQFIWDPASTDLDLVGYIIITEETSINALYNNLNFSNILDTYHAIRTQQAQEEYSSIMDYERNKNNGNLRERIESPQLNLIKRLDELEQNQTEYMGVYDEQNGFILNRWDNKISNDRIILYHYFRQNKKGGIDYEIRTDAFYYEGAELLLYREENYCKRYPISTLVYNNLPQSMTGFSLGMQLYRLQGSLYEAGVNETYASNIASKLQLLVEKIGMNGRDLKESLVKSAENKSADNVALVSEAERLDASAIANKIHILDTTKQATVSTNRTNNILQQMNSISMYGDQNASNSGKSMTTGKGISSLQERNLKVENLFTSNIESYMQKNYEIMTMFIKDKFTARTLPLSYKKASNSDSNKISQIVDVDNPKTGGLMNNLADTYLKPKISLMNQSPANKVKNTNLVGQLLPILAQNKATQYGDISPIINKVTGDPTFADAISKMIADGRKQQLAMARLLDSSASNAKVAEKQEETRGKLLTEALKSLNKGEKANDKKQK